MPVLTMDNVGGKLGLDDYLYVVVQTKFPYIVNTTPHYNVARRMRILSEFESVILAIKPETLEAIENGDIREIIV